MNETHLQSNLEYLYNAWIKNPIIGECIKYKTISHANQNETYQIPDNINTHIHEALRKQEIISLYKHQVDSIREIQTGNNIIVVSNTSSGKTLCYNIPIINAALTNPNLTALYLYPTKALAQDQKNKLDNLLGIDDKTTLNNSSGLNIIKSSIYDGDTPVTDRRNIRESTQILLTNPDMLHLNILPQHSRWVRFLRNLKFVILDEAHVYRGVFGSHIANIIRRLGRILNYYKTTPQFVLTSATIGNPIQFSKNLIGKPVVCVEGLKFQNANKYYIFYNPPIINQEFGVRKSSMQESVQLADDLINNNIQTLVFTRSRKATELFVKKIKEKNDDDDNIHGYRSGYLAPVRRKIESDLRENKAKCVVATNALELGIDIGSIQAVILVGYPGSVASTLQQFGRAGRNDQLSIAIFVATQSPLDQYLIDHPEYILNNNIECALIDPDNLTILYNHLKCAAAELPFKDNDRYGNLPQNLLTEFITIFEREGLIIQNEGSYYWSVKENPSKSVSIRNSSESTIILQEELRENLEIIGQVDEVSSYWMVHPHAIYLQEGISYQVKELNLVDKFAVLLKTDSDYYTIPLRKNTIDDYLIIKEKQMDNGLICFGEISITSQVQGYRKICLDHSTMLGEYPLDMPSSKLITKGFWLTLNNQSVSSIQSDGLWLNYSVNYGTNWEKQKVLAKRRDNFTCQVCGKNSSNVNLHVHHKTPIRLFQEVEFANHLENLVTLCPECHRFAENRVRIRSGLSGFGYALHHLAPLYLMCEINDLVLFHEQSPTIVSHDPIIILHEQIQGGTGLCDKLFDIHQELLIKVHEAIRDCPCTHGCPSCVGPISVEGYGGKNEALAIVNQFLIEK